MYKLNFSKFSEVEFDTLHKHSINSDLSVPGLFFSYTLSLSQVGDTYLDMS